MGELVEVDWESRRVWRNGGFGCIWIFYRFRTTNTFYLPLKYRKRSINALLMLCVYVVAANRVACGSNVVTSPVIPWSPVLKYVG